MRRPITIGIAVGMTSFFALMFWQIDTIAMDPVGVQKNPEYALTANPYLPIEWLRPAW